MSKIRHVNRYSSEVVGDQERSEFCGENSVMMTAAFREIIRKQFTGRPGAKAGRLAQSAYDGAIARGKGCKYEIVWEETEKPTGVG